MKVPDFFTESEAAKDSAEETKNEGEDGAAAGGTAEDGGSGDGGRRRQLVSMEQIDVQRDIMKIYFDQGDLDAEEDPNDNIKFLQIETWTETDFDVKIFWDDPFAVSSGKTRDNLHIELRSAEYFQSANGGPGMSDAQLSVSKTIPPQLPKGVSAEELARQAAAMDKAMKAILIL